MINVLLSTYNEAENITGMLRMLVETLEGLSVPFLIVIVDGDSPDRTSEVARRVKHTSIRIVDEECRAGLGAAYTKGLPFCRYKYTVVLDADFQHDPSAIASMFKCMTHEDCDLVVGTRYAGGGRISSWSLPRRVCSAFANNLAKLALGMRSTDLTGSFRCYRTELLRDLLGDAVCTGFGIQVELLARAEAINCKICEVPITFYERTAGKSKFCLEEVYLFLKTLLILFILL